MHLTVPFAKQSAKLRRGGSVTHGCCAGTRRISVVVVRCLPSGRWPFRSRCRILRFEIIEDGAQWNRTHGLPGWWSHRRPWASWINEVLSPYFVQNLGHARHTHTHTRTGDRLTGPDRWHPVWHAGPSTDVVRATGCHSLWLRGLLNDYVAPSNFLSNWLETVGIVWQCKARKMHISLNIETILHQDLKKWLKSEQFIQWCL